MPGRRLSLTLLGLVGLALLVAAQAQDIEISTEEGEGQLEFRNVTLPDGTESQLVVIQGSPVTVTIDGDTIVAEYIEFDEENGLLRIVGPVTFTSETETIQGEDFVIELDDESFQGRNVLIITEEMDVLGVEATRFPGQIDVLEGRFSPCSRCGQQVQDYGFRAGRLILYPGDRLVAFDVTVLIREVPVFFLPLLVFPLGPQDRQPRFSISRGTATTRAEIALDWPYTAGANAFGVTRLRYYADVVPGAGGFFAENLLGGAVEASYFGGGFDHIFFTDRGEGRIEFFYLPAFNDPSELDGATDDEFTMRFAYETAPEVAPPSFGLLIEREDARRPRIVEYRLESANVTSGVEASYLSQGFVDLLPEDEVDTPSYAGRSVPEFTFSQLTLEPEADAFSVGPFILNSLLVDLGFFQDVGNPLNRSAALLGRVSAGRLLEEHHLELTPLEPWPGFSISGETDFQGRYYTTAERLVNWDTDIRLRQGFSGAGNLTLDLNREIREGETPFRFDTTPLRSRIDLTGQLTLTPFSWLRYEGSETYVFLDSRRPDQEGFGPIRNELTLFGNLDWLELTLEETYDVCNAVEFSNATCDAGDPGVLETQLVLSAPERDFDASLTIAHDQDLKITPDRVLGLPEDESETRYELEFGYRPYLMFDMSGGYDFDPPPPDEGDPVLEHQLPFELGLTFGTLEQNDATPGFRFSYQRDLNRHAMRELGLEFSARVGDLMLAIEQEFDFIDNDLGQSEYSLTWEGVAAFEASGFALLPPSVVGLELDDDPQQREYTLRDDPEDGDPRWRWTYTTEFNPVLPDGGTGFRDSELEAFVNYANVGIGAVDFSVDFSANLALRDEELPRTYLRSADLEFSTDIAGVVGFQGELAYRVSYLEATDTFSRQRLTIDDFGPTVKLFDQLYLSALLNDVWEFAADDPDQSPWNFQPTFYVVWDRCCWALYGSWDTMTGEVTLSITTPGGDEGLVQAFDSGLRLPGRREEE